MSFDSTFDYSNAKTYLDDMIVQHQARSDEFQAKIDELAGVTGYDDKIADATDSYTRQKSVYDELVSRYQAVKDEILAVEAIDPADKAKLYSFYQLVGESLESWMGRMLFNYSNILVDADFNALLVDVTNSENDKAKVGELVCMSFPTDRRGAELNSYFSN